MVQMVTIWYITSVVHMIKKNGNQTFYHERKKWIRDIKILIMIQEQALWRFHDLTTQRTIEERPNSNYTMVNPKNGDEFPVNPLRCWAITIDTFDKYYEENRVKVKRL